MKDTCGSGDSLEINTPSCDVTSCVEPCSSPIAPCPENHCLVEVKNQFCTTIKVMNAWNVPDCGEQAILEVPNVLSALPGSYLWSSTYGYFEVISYNATTQQLVIQNNCQNDNASPGTAVLACSQFIVVDAPFSATDPTEFPYVALDFTAPADGNCLDILVTSTIGLTAGSTIQIGNGIYVLNAITSPTLINICNEGEGLIPGTVVVSVNAAGDYQYPITTIGANPCANASVEEGALVVCAGSKAVPLGGDTVGSVPVLQDAGTGEVIFEALDGIFNSSSVAVVGANVTLTDGDASRTSTSIAVVLTNPSLTRPMHVLANYYAYINVEYTGPTEFSTSFEKKVDAGAFTNIATYTDELPDLGGAYTGFPRGGRNYDEIITVAPGATTTITTRIIVAKTINAGVSNFNLKATSTHRVNYFGVPA